jgi:putative heme-binding domain-containing protein
MIGILGPALAETTPSADEHDPATELASFTIAPGFEVNLFASEKHGVVKPIQIRFDPQGRLWVIGSTVYPQLEPGQVPNDKVLVLEDTDGDGSCDKTTVFADGLMIPTGIELGDGGVYIGHGTELLFLKDTNGDLKADERRVVLRGFGTGDNHQNINSFIFGPGGELWFCQGLHTHSNVETPWGIVRMNQAGLWRFRPKIKKLEGFFGSIYEPQNPWGYVFTDWGEPIVIAGNNSSIMYPVPGLTARHFPLAPPLIWKNGGGRKSSGADIVGTAHFPEDWQGVIITGGYINNAVWALDIKDDGAGFALVDREPLIKSTSRNFRPVDVKFGPDGSLYICDWYNPIIGHYQASFRHPDRDKNHGRIWRVTAKGRPLTRRPNLTNTSVTDLLEQLKSKDRWTRQFARRALADRDSKEVAAAIEPWRVNGRPSEQLLKEALGVLQSHEVVHEQLLLQVALSDDPGGRAFAASAIGRWADRLPNAIELLRPLASDSHPRVRLHAIVASSYIPKWEAIEIAARAAELKTDKFIDYALRQAVFALKPHWQIAERLGKFTPAADENTFNLFLKVGETKELAMGADYLLASTPDFSRKVAIGRSIVTNGTIADLNSIIALKDGALRDELMPLLLQTVRQRRIAPEPATKQLLREQVKVRDSEALALAGLWQLEEFRAELAAVARETSLPNGPRIAAIEGLSGWKHEEAARTLNDLAINSAGPVRIAAIAALAGSDLETAARLAAESDVLPGDWNVLIEGFLQRKGGTAALAKAFEKKTAGSAVAALIIRVMNETGRRDEALVKVLAPASRQTLTLADIPQLASEVRARGSAERGEQVYQRAELACVTCHAVKGFGGAIGPDLGALGTAQPTDFIIGAILDPQREVKEGYISTSVTTKSGDEYQGYVIQDEGAELVLNDILQKATVTIPKNQIQQRRQSGSAMPAGLVDALTREEFVDLVKYLSELGK